MGVGHATPPKSPCKCLVLILYLTLFLHIFKKYIFSVNYVGERTIKGEFSTQYGILEDSENAVDNLHNMLRCPTRLPHAVSHTIIAHNS